jgi:hypothetical protein
MNIFRSATSSSAVTRPFVGKKRTVLELNRTICMHKIMRNHARRYQRIPFFLPTFTNADSQYTRVVF